MGMDNAHMEISLKQYQVTIKTRSIYGETLTATGTTWARNKEEAILHARESIFKQGVREEIGEPVAKLISDSKQPRTPMTKKKPGAMKGKAKPRTPKWKTGRRY